MFSDGDRPFSVDITNATFTPRLEIDTRLQDNNWWAASNQNIVKDWYFSDSVDAACGENGDVQITELEFPFRWISPFELSWIKCYFSYDDISIMFDNLGYGYNAVINGLSIFILKTQVNNSTNPKSDFLFMWLHLCIILQYALIFDFQEENLKGMVRSLIKDTVHSIIC